MRDLLNAGEGDSIPLSIAMAFSLVFLLVLGILVYRKRDFFNVDEEGVKEGLPSKKEREEAARRAALPSSSASHKHVVDSVRMFPKDAWNLPSTMREGARKEGEERR